MRDALGTMRFVCPYHGDVAPRDVEYSKPAQGTCPHCWIRLKEIKPDKLSEETNVNDANTVNEAAEPEEPSAVNQAMEILRGELTELALELERLVGTLEPVTLPCHASDEKEDSEWQSDCPLVNQLHDRIDQVTDMCGTVALLNKSVRL